MHVRVRVRYGLAVVGLLVLLGVLAAIKWSQIATLMAFAEDAERAGPPPEAVAAATAVEREWEDTLHAVGTVAESAGVSVSNEVPGIVKRVAFESGEDARKGEVLVVLDASVEQAELEAALAAAELANVTAARTRLLVERRAVAADALDRAEAERESAAARVGMLRAQIAKKTIRAPFSGRLGIREVNPGELIEPGTTITELGSTGATFVDFTLPQEHLGSVEPGAAVRIHLRGREGEPLEGSIAALAPHVDASTRAVDARAAVRGAEELLRPGMFVDVDVVLPERDEVVVVPATSIVHAPYGDSVYVVDERDPAAPGPPETADGKRIYTARQQFVRTGRRRGDFVEIREGLEAGREVVSAGAFKLRNGAPIYLTDDVSPDPQLEPSPENR